MVTLSFHVKINTDNTYTPEKDTDVTICIQPDESFQEALGKACLKLNFLRRGYGFSAKPDGPDVLPPWRTISATDTPLSLGWTDENLALHIEIWRAEKPLGCRKNLWSTYARQFPKPGHRVTRDTVP
jgi:hypothetical protein